MAIDVVAAAQNAARLKYGTPIANAQNSLTKSDIIDQAAINAINDWKGTGGAAIQTAYDALGRDLVANRASNTEQFNQGLVANQQAYDIAQQNTDARKQESLNYLASLGFGGSTAAAQVANTYDTNANNLGQYGANAQVDMRNWADKRLSLLGDYETQGKLAGANAQGTFQSDALQALSDAQLNKSTHQFDLNAALQGLISEQSAYEATQQDMYSQQNYENSLKEAAQALAARQFEASQANQAADDAWRREQAGLSRSDSLAQQARDQANLDRGYNLDLQKLGMQEQDTTYAGQQGLNLWAQSLALPASTMDAITRQWQDAQGASIVAASDLANPRSLDPYTLALAGINNNYTTDPYSHSPSSLNPDTIRAGLAILAGKYGGRTSG